MLLSLRELVAAAAKLFLQRFAGLLRLSQREGPLAQRLSFRIEPALSVAELIEPPLHERILLGDTGRLTLQLKGAFTDPLFFPANPILGFLELGDRAGEDGLSFRDLLALL